MEVGGQMELLWGSGCYGEGGGGGGARMRLDMRRGHSMLWPVGELSALPPAWSGECEWGFRSVN